MYRVLVWSMHVLMSGCFPSHSWDGAPFKGARNRWRASMAGKPIADGLVFGVTEILGDCKWLNESLQLVTTYAHTEVCMHCYADKSAGQTGFADFRHQAGHRARVRTHEEYMSLYRDRPPWLARLPGFHSGLVKADFMHVFLLGVSAWVCGNILIELCQQERFGQFRCPKRLRFNLQLRVAWQMFKRHCSTRGWEESQPCFSLNKLGFAGNNVGRGVA